MEEVVGSQVVDRKKLLADFRVVVSDVEQLLHATASQTGEKIVAARARVQESLHGARERLTQAEHELAEQGKAAARATDQFVRQNPWQAVGIGAVLGLLVGLVVGRR